MALRRVLAHDLCSHRIGGADVLPCRLLAHRSVLSNHGVFTRNLRLGARHIPAMDGVRRLLLASLAVVVFGAAHGAGTGVAAALAEPAAAAVIHPESMDEFKDVVYEGEFVLARFYTAARCGRVCRFGAAVFDSAAALAATRVPREHGLSMVAVDVSRPELAGLARQVPAGNARPHNV